ncbi:MAG: hydroxymethylpyrimidine/phosphomethylpyrimidine kinase [Chloroflexota bacterium]|jgi:hydroxymethylpyrimidine/phosphomethylpyrimidine kinase|nr:MAG: hydroxymethylpyrimidine/phosphomethylpyrimidine kinase [Chloroflexota bacterium]|tara:strand:- start:5650 stop:6441 length:792 start_codon:yes stop_codon:yes gene_type:complete
MSFPPKSLTIAGSDSGGGAGIQADLKTFASLGVYGTSAITAVTSQNTLGVTDIVNIPAKSVISQIEAIISDIGTDSIKTGMLSDASIVNAVSSYISQSKFEKVIVDPVMISKSGHKLLSESAIKSMVEMLIPISFIITPNIPEASIISETKINSIESAKIAAKKIVKLGAKTCIVKGGHFEGPPIDVFYDGKKYETFKSKRINTKNTHGTGCTFSAAIAAYIAKGEDVISAISKSKNYINSAIQENFLIGKGHGPLNHFYKQI